MSGVSRFWREGEQQTGEKKKYTHTREIPCADITATGSEGSNASVPGARVSQRTEADARTWRTTQVAHLAIASMLQFLTNFTRGWNLRTDLLGDVCLFSRSCFEDRQTPSLNVCVCVSVFWVGSSILRVPSRLFGELVTGCFNLRYFPHNPVAALERRSAVGGC